MKEQNRVESDVDFLSSFWRETEKAKVDKQDTDTRPGRDYVYKLMYIARQDRELGRERNERHSCIPFVIAACLDGASRESVTCSSRTRQLTLDQQGPAAFHRHHQQQQPTAAAAHSNSPTNGGDGQTVGYIIQVLTSIVASSTDPQRRRRRRWWNPTTVVDTCTRPFLLYSVQ